MSFVNLYGGIGNQLFCYAFARAVQIETGEKYLYFSKKRFLFTYRNDFVKPECILDYYQLSPNKVKIWSGNISTLFFLVLREIYRNIYREDSEHLTIKQFYRRVKGGYICARNEVCLCSDVSELSLQAPIKYIEGLFQWPEAFLHLRSKLREELTLCQSMSEHAAKLLNDIKNSESVCLHIRRGDFLVYSWAQVCNFDYYKKAMDYIVENVDAPVFYVFSDDIEWVKRNYTIPYSHIFVEENHAAPFEMELMRNCHHFIMSNSTFSWWAQFLSWEDTPTVVAPKPWFADNRKCAIYLPYWHVIDSVGGMER